MYTIPLITIINHMRYSFSYAPFHSIYDSQSSCLDPYTFLLMWLFSTSNTTIVEEKRCQRSEALIDVLNTSEAQYAFLKATGEFTNLHVK